VIFLSNQEHIFDMLNDGLQIKRDKTKYNYLSLKKIFQEKLDGKLENKNKEDDDIEKRINCAYINYQFHNELFCTLLGEKKDLNKIDLPFSFNLNIKFELATPFISRGDEKFYPHENPISKEHVFKAPYIKASSFRGNLQRSILFLLFSNSNLDKDKIREKRKQYIRLFGTEQKSIKNILDRITRKEKEDNEGFWNELYEKGITDINQNTKGRVHFSDVFFKRGEDNNNIRTIEYINPHSRKERKGKNPISIEAVNSGSEGKFKIVYFPIPNNRKKKKRKKAEFNNDLKTVIKGMEKMMFKDGFGAKRSRGYGLVNKKSVKIKLFLNNESDINSDLKEFLGKKEVQICE